MKIQLYSLGKKFDIILCSETWLGDSCLQFSLPGYDFFHQNRGSRGGGVCAYINSNIHAQVVDEFTCAVQNGFEAITLNIIKGSTSVMVSSIYRSPSSNPQILFNHLSAFLDDAKFKNARFILAGDFNLDLAQVALDSKVDDFINLLESHNLVSTIIMPTRVQGNSKSVIGCIFSHMYPNFVWYYN